MPDNTVMAEIEQAAKTLGVETAALAAVAYIESALRAHTLVSGRPEPLIRFEGHYFDRRLSTRNRAEARRLQLSSPTAGAIRNPASQQARWTLLNRAAQLDRTAAFESTSWGLGQVMGAHWLWLGYPGMEAFVGDARSGVAGQLRLMTRYIDKAGLVPALRQRDWKTFARGYNGPGYRKNRYDMKLAAAYERFAHSSAASPTSLLRRGARGERVAALQTLLAEHGFRIAVDAHFGPQTEQVVRQFQRSRQLSVDGIVGPATLTALKAPRSDAKWSLLGWLRNVLHRALEI